MPGQNILGKFAACCDPCAAAFFWPDTIYLTLSGITGCSCPGNGATSYDFSACNGTYSLQRIIGNSWAVPDPQNTPYTQINWAATNCTGDSTSVQLYANVFFEVFDELDNDLHPTGRCEYRVGFGGLGLVGVLYSPDNPLTGTYSLQLQPPMACGSPAPGYPDPIMDGSGSATATISL